MCFYLLYRTEQGSGLGLTLADIHEMPIHELVSWYEMLGERHELEAEARARNAQ